MLTHQAALFHDVALVINVMRYSVIPNDLKRGGGLESVVSEHANMVAKLKALQKKNQYDGILKMIDVTELEDSDDDEAPRIDSVRASLSLR